MKIDHFLVFLSVWLPQDFVQVKEWLMLELQKIITVLDVVGCPILFNLFYDQS